MIIVITTDGTTIGLRKTKDYICLLWKGMLSGNWMLTKLPTSTGIWTQTSHSHCLLSNRCGGPDAFFILLVGVYIAASINLYCKDNHKPTRTNNVTQRADMDPRWMFGESSFPTSPMNIQLMWSIGLFVLISICVSGRPLPGRPPSGSRVTILDF